MSREDDVPSTRPTLPTPAPAIALRLEARARPLGGVSVRRLLPHRRQRSVGPWVFLDHMGPTVFPPGPGVEVPPHPHIHLATVTYLFAGEILHRDSLGSVQPIRPGDLNLMVAGRGIVHSERERPARRAESRPLHGLQLWLALPEAHEDDDPSFHHHPASTLPQVEVGGVAVRVMMGTAYGVTSPVQTYSPTVYVEAHLAPGQTLQLPSEALERALYVAEGEVRLDGDTLPETTLAVLREDATVTVTATRQTRLALLGGSPLGKRYMEWNFASSRPEAIAQAKADWRAGKFPTVPGDEDERIELP